MVSSWVALLSTAPFRTWRLDTRAGQGHIWSSIVVFVLKISYDILPSLDEASMSVDALVADSATDFLTNEIDNQEENATSITELEFPTARKSTPSVPPGVSLPHAHPIPAMREENVTKSSSRIVPTSAPFTPSRNLTPAYMPRATTPLDRVSVSVVSPEATKPTPGVASAIQARQDVKNLAASTGLSKAIASQSAEVMQASALTLDDFPELEKGKEKQDANIVLKTIAPMQKKTQTPINEIFQSQSITKSVAKKSTSGILSNAGPNLLINKASNEPEGIAKSIIPSSAFPPLPPSAPSFAPAQTPAIRNNNTKALRLVPTPRTEILPAVASTPQSAVSANATSFPPPSRQPSIASLSRNDRPSTPVSEVISDNASITSNSLSRPSSPPATRVGSAPVRSTTKSQQKKQRREAKEKSELDTVIDKPEPQVEIAPIMGRKKKQKKEKVSSTAGGASPAVSRAPSPGPHQPVLVDVSTKPEIVTESDDANQISQAEPEPAVIKVLDVKGKAKAKIEEPESPTLPAETMDEQAEKSIPVPASVLSDLVSSGLLPDPSKLNVFKSPFGSTQRQDFSGDFRDAEQKLLITKEDQAALQAGKPIHKVVRGSNRIMLTPNGDCVRYLTAAEEERYLELQSRILNDTGPASFMPPRHTVNGGFALIGGRAVPNGPPAYFPMVNASAAHLDPVGKIQRDEALAYINQFVLPSLSTNSQLERALNANALDTEMLRPNSLGAWGDTSSQSAEAGEQHIDSISVPDRSYGAIARDNSILATGLQSMTAHFAMGQDTARSQPLGNVALLSLEDSEKALQSAKKETEKLEKSLNQLLKKNRRLLLGAGH